MFRIEFFVDDSKLAKTLWALRQIGVYLTTPPQPVINAKASNGEVKAKSDRPLLDLFGAYLGKARIKQIDPPQIKAFVTKHGRLEKSYSNLLRDAVNAGMLQRIDKSFRYRVKRAGINHHQKTKG